MERLRIALVLSDVFLRRLTPAFFPLVESRQDYWIINVRRPVRDLQRLLDEISPSGVITELLPEKTDAVLAAGLPTVVVDSDDVYPGAVSIDVDDEMVGQRAAEYFLSAGFQHFAFLGNRRPYSLQRMHGFESALKKNGYSCHSHLEPENRKVTYMEHFRGESSSLRQWLLELPKPCALFAAHDPMGRLVCEVAQEERIPVPEEIAVIGANDDDLLCNLSYPPLSSVIIPWLNIGKIAGREIDQLVSGQVPGGRVIQVAPGKVVHRQSSEWTAVDDPDLRRALEYMRLHFQEGISIKTLCATLRMNRRTLERKFQDKLNCTPRQQLARIRIDRAKELLAETNHKMDWIAAEVGLASAERLSVVFGQIDGSSPSTYRTQIQG